MSDFTPRRIVSLQPSATVILDRLGLLERVVACTKYCKAVVPEVARRRIELVEDSWRAQAEQIVRARSDLVIAAVPYQPEAVAEILKAGVRFLGLAPRSLADVYGDISMIAGVMGASERGADLVAEMQGEMASARARNRGKARPRVFCEEWGKPIIHSQPWVRELVEAAGGEFVGEPGQKTDAQAGERAAPEVVILAWCGAGSRVPLERIVRERGWDSLPAVRARRVYCLSDELLNTPAPTLIEGLHALEAVIHDDRSADLPPQRAKFGRAGGSDLPQNVRRIGA